MTISLHAGDITEHTLPNGLKVIHKYDSAHDVVVVDLFIRGGAREEPDSKAGIALLTQALITRGTKNRTVIEIADETDLCGGFVSASISEDYLEMYIREQMNQTEKSAVLLLKIKKQTELHRIVDKPNNLIAALILRKEGKNQEAFSLVQTWAAKSPNNDLSHWA